VTEAWAWVIAAYLVVYGTLAVYAALLARRLRRAQRLLDGP
jgi:hypothetical protein